MSRQATIDDEGILFPDSFNKETALAYGSNPNLLKTYEKLRAWIRQVRGGILSGSYYIEQNIHSAIRSYFLDASAIDHAVKLRVFNDGLISPLSSDRSISPAGMIAAERNLDAVEFKYALNGFKTIRNAVAHNPCWFNASVSDDGQVVELMPYMDVGKQPVHLTVAKIAEWNELTGSLIGQTKALSC